MPAVLLIAMPWEFGPSIQLGVLHGLLARHGVDVASRSLFVDAMVHFTRATPGPGPRVRWTDYIQIASRHFDAGVGDWIFAVPPFHDTTARDAEYLDLLRRRGVPADMIDKAVRMKRAVPAYLEQCVDDVLRAEPRVVGFTTTFSQNVPSLVLARMLKERRPELVTLFGGANCDGPMGAALHREFPWIDVVVRGEAERVLPPLVAELVAGERSPPRPTPPSRWPRSPRRSTTSSSSASIASPSSARTTARTSSCRSRARAAAGGARSHSARSAA
jgi:hypothetical protein